MDQQPHAVAGARARVRAGAVGAPPGVLRRRSSPRSGCRGRGRGRAGGRADSRSSNQAIASEVADTSAVLRIDDRHPGTAAGAAGRRMGRRATAAARGRRSARSSRRTRPRPREAARRPGAVEMQQPPAAAAGVERRAQLRVGVHERPQLAPPALRSGRPPVAACRSATGRGPRARSPNLLKSGTSNSYSQNGWHTVGGMPRTTPAPSPSSVSGSVAASTSASTGMAARELLGDALDEVLGRAAARRRARRSVARLARAREAVDGMARRYGTPRGPRRCG